MLGLKGIRGGPGHPDHEIRGGLVLNFFRPFGPKLASNAGVFRGAHFSSLPTNTCSNEDNIPFPCLANHIVLSKFCKVDLDHKVI